MSESSSPRKESTGKKGWVAPSFGGFDTISDPAVNKRPPVKRMKRDVSGTSRIAKTAVHNAAVKSTRLNNKLGWVDKYAPQTKSDLAVHARKVDDVFDWLYTALKRTNKAPILVLSGPPGSGKTATLRVASKEMNFLLREWITPVNNNLFTEDVEGNKKFESGYRSEYDLVKSFLLCASRFPSVLAGEDEVQDSVVLMEDLPLTFHRDPGVFRDLLWEFSEVGKSPLVIIIGDNKVYRKLFNEIIISQLSIKVIEFNPVAMTIITKLLQNIIHQESQNVANKTFQNPPSDVINSIYESSCGDLRSAINTLQFACLRGVTNISKAVAGKSTMSPKKAPSKKAKLTATKNKELDQAAIGGRDPPEDFFRVIGRVLYAKREAPDSLEQKRGALVHNPHDIVMNYSGNNEFFMSFLHENYLNHFNKSLNNVEKAAEYFSIADVIMSSSKVYERDLPKQLGLSVSVLGLMYTHPDDDKPAGAGFRPQKKPRSGAADIAYLERRKSARQLFPNSHCCSYELLTELVPYIALIGGQACESTAQLSFVQSSKLDRYGSVYGNYSRNYNPVTASITNNQREVSGLTNGRFSSAQQEDENEDAKLIEEIVDSD